jgi:hypothetical protein
MIPGITFKQKKGLHKGDPLSPIQFNIMADMFTIIINRAKEDEKVSRLIPHLVDGGRGSPFCNMSMIQLYFRS